MNRHCNKGSSSKSNLTRETIVTKSTTHTTSKYKSIQGTRSFFAWYFDPKKTNGVYVRRYACPLASCSTCASGDFLACKDSSMGTWEFRKYEKKRQRMLFNNFYIELYIN